MLGLRRPSSWTSDRQECSELEVAKAGGLPSSGCFYELGILLSGVLIIIGLLLGVFIRAPNFWKLPCHVGPKLNGADS